MELNKLKRLSNDKGAAAVEFALLLLPLTLIIFGLMIFGVTLNRYLEITHAAREGVRWAALRSELGDVSDDPLDPDPLKATSIRGRAAHAAPGVTLTNPDIVVTGVTPPATDDNQGDPVTVRITYDNSDMGLLAGFDIFLPTTISSSATQRVE